MAYGNYLATVSEQEVLTLRKEPDHLLKTGSIAKVSHLIAYWIDVQPLGQLLNEALDGGEVLSPHLWHPLRKPTFHSPERASHLFKQLRKVWNEAVQRNALGQAAMFRQEIERLLEIFREADRLGQGVASVLEPPMDNERAGKVRIPFAVEG